MYDTYNGHIFHVTRETTTNDYACSDYGKQLPAVYAIKVNNSQEQYSQEQWFYDVVFPETFKIITDDFACMSSLQWISCNTQDHDDDYGTQLPAVYTIMMKTSHEFYDAVFSVTFKIITDSSACTTFLQWTYFHVTHETTTDGYACGDYGTHLPYMQYGD